MSKPRSRNGGVSGSRVFRSMPAMSSIVTKRLASVRLRDYASALQVDPVRDGVHFDPRQRQRPARQNRQLLRQPDVDISVPKSEQPDQAFPGARRILTKRSKVSSDFCVKGLLASLVELVQRAGLAEF